MIWFLQLTTLIADKTIEDITLVIHATIVKWALFNSRKELVRSELLVNTTSKLITI